MKFTINHTLTIFSLLLLGTTGISAESGSKSKISLSAGHNVVDAVDDLRETVKDLAKSVQNAGDKLGYTDWNDANTKLSSMINNLDEMESRLDKKADNTDSSWLNWLADRDYGVSVKREISDLGNHLKSLGDLLAKEKAKVNLQAVVGHNVVDQVDEVRETTRDLLNAISDSGPELGWFDDEAKKQFPKYTSQLDSMEKTLDEKAEMSDEDWSLWVNDVKFRTYVHEQVNELAGMLTDLSKRVTVPAS